MTACSHVSHDATLALCIDHFKVLEQALGRPNESWKTASKNAVATCSIVWWHQVLHQLHSTPPKLRRSTVLLYSFLFTDLASSTFHRQVFGRKLQLSGTWDLPVKSGETFWNAHKRSTLGAWRKKTPSWTRITSQIRAQNDTKIWRSNQPLPPQAQWVEPSSGCWKNCVVVVADSGFCWLLHQVFWCFLVVESSL